MTCEACGGELQRDVAELEIRDGPRWTVIAQAGWYCWGCGAARFTARDLAQAERQLRAAEPARPAPSARPAPVLITPAKAA